MGRDDRTPGAGAGLACFVRDDRGELLVELAIAIPIMVIIGLITINLMQFIGQCAKFDRATGDLVRYAVLNPQDNGNAATGLLAKSMGYEGNDPNSNHVSVQVRDYDGPAGSVVGHYLKTVDATLYFKPWPALDAVYFENTPFRFQLPGQFMQHKQRYVVDAFKPGILL